MLDTYSEDELELQRALQSNESTLIGSSRESKYWNHELNPSPVCKVTRQSQQLSPFFLKDKTNSIVESESPESQKVIFKKRKPIQIESTTPNARVIKKKPNQINISSLIELSKKHSTSSDVQIIEKDHFVDDVQDNVSDSSQSPIIFRNNLNNKTLMSNQHNISNEEKPLFEQEDVQSVNDINSYYLSRVETMNKDAAVVNVNYKDVEDKPKVVVDIRKNLLNWLSANKTK